MDPGLPWCFLVQRDSLDFARRLDHILPAMKWLFVLLLALIIFGGAAWFGYNTFVKEEIAVKKEQRGEVTPAACARHSVFPNFRRQRNSGRMEN